MGGDRYTAAEKIAILEKGVALFAVIFDDDPLFYADRLANSYRQLAILHGQTGNTEAAVTCFERMADYAIRFDERPDTATYFSVIINRVPYDRDEDTDSHGSKCARLLRGGLSARIWAPIRTDERVRAAAERMIRCAEAYPEDEE